MIKDSLSRTNQGPKPPRQFQTPMFAMGQVSLSGPSFMYVLYLIFPQMAFVRRARRQQVARKQQRVHTTGGEGRTADESGSVTSMIAGSGCGKRGLAYRLVDGSHACRWRCWALRDPIPVGHMHRGQGPTLIGSTPPPLWCSIYPVLCYAH